MIVIHLGNNPVDTHITSANRSPFEGQYRRRRICGTLNAVKQYDFLKLKNKTWWTVWARSVAARSNLGAALERTKATLKGTTLGARAT